MYQLQSEYKISEAQKRASDEITDKFAEGRKRQTLLGVTGSGKTFVMADIIRKLGRPVLVLAHNKVLAAQLYREFSNFFPKNSVGYFISYYDYYQPEAYIPQKGKYIAKEVSINAELEKMRIDAARGLLESEFSVVVASVSAIYNIGAPDEFFKSRVAYYKGLEIERSRIVDELFSLGYRPFEGMLERGQYRVRGDVVEVFASSEDFPFRIFLDEGKVEFTESFDPVNGEVVSELQMATIFPVSYFHYRMDVVNRACEGIETELKTRTSYLRENSQEDFAERLEGRTRYDIEMLKTRGFCSGIENYSLHMTGRKPGDPPYCLLDYFPEDYLLIVDESHITIPQVQGMYEGDRSRKSRLIDYGFRLPSAYDNRPLKFNEFNANLDKVLYVSATPGDYEIGEVGGAATELLTRPTGLIDPPVEFRNSENPVEDLIIEVNREVEQNNRVLITTLTKKMAEALTDHMHSRGIRAVYMHSEVKPLDRIRIIENLKKGEFDVLIGINLLREGLDLPEVALVAILDADCEGFLRSRTSLIQTFGRAARNTEGRVIAYGRSVSGALKEAMEESLRRREYQVSYNEENGITPEPIPTAKLSDSASVTEKKNYNSREQVEKEIDKLTADMKKRAEALDFKKAAELRDRITELKNLVIEVF